MAGNAEDRLFGKPGRRHVAILEDRMTIMHCNRLTFY